MTPEQDNRQRRRKEERRAEKEAEKEAKRKAEQEAKAAKRSAATTASVSNELSIEMSPAVKAMQANREAARLTDALHKHNNFENIFLDILVGDMVNLEHVKIYEDNHEAYLRVRGESGKNEPYCRCELEWLPSARQDMGDIYMYTSVASNDEAENKLSQYVSNTRSNWEWLRETLNRKGDYMLNAWTKMKAMRQRLIVEACPGIQTTKHPLLHAMFDSKDLIERRIMFRKALLLPCFNVEALLENDNLLSLIYHRTNSEPRKFTSVDLTLFSEAFDKGLLERQVNQDMVWTHHGTNYGVLSYSQCSRIYLGLAVGYPRALMFFEAQDYLFHCLRGIVERLLKGVEHDSGSRKWKQHVREHFGKPADIELPFSQAAFFDSPPRPDIAYWLMQLTALTNACEDEIAGLQQVPRVLHVNISQMRSSPFLRKVGTNVSAWRLMDGHLALPFRRMDALMAIEQSLQELKVATDEFCSSSTSHIEPVDPPPMAASTKVAEIADKLQHSCKDFVTNQQNNLCQSLIFSEHCAEFFDIKAVQTGQTTLEGVKHKPGLLKLAARRRMFLEDPLKWVIFELSLPVSGSAGDTVASLGTLIAFWYEHVLRFKDDTRFEGNIRLILEDLANVSALALACNFMPRAGTLPETPDLADSDLSESPLHSAISSDGHSSEWEDEPEEPELAWLPTRISNPESARLNRAHYLELAMQKPWPNVLNLGTLDQVTLSRDALRAYWNSVRDMEIGVQHDSDLDQARAVFQMQREMYHEQWDHRIFLKDQTNDYYRLCDLDREEAAEESRREAEQMKLSSAAPRTPSPEEASDSSEGDKIYTSQQSSPGKRRRLSLAQPWADTEELFGPPHKKAKKKTRPVLPPTPAPEPEANAPGDAEVPPTLPKKYVSKNSVEVFHQMWANVSGAARAGSKQRYWRDIETAMREAGWPCLRAGRGNGGSERPFLKSDPEEAGPPRIVFHKPHGKPITPGMLKGWGSKLSTHMGWSWDMFVERRKRPREGGDLA